MLTNAITLWEIICADGTTTQDFAVDEWLAIRLRWVDPPSSEILRIHYKAELDSDSWITSPPTDPGYPVPELSTIILFSMGLLLLGGYVWLKRRRACP